MTRHRAFRPGAFEALEDRCTPSHVAAGVAAHAHARLHAHVASVAPRQTIAVAAVPILNTVTASAAPPTTGAIPASVLEAEMELLAGAGLATRPLTIAPPTPLTTATTPNTSRATGIARTSLAATQAARALQAAALANLLASQAASPTASNALSTAILDPTFTAANGTGFTNFGFNSFGFSNAFGAGGTGSVNNGLGVATDLTTNGFTGAANGLGFTNFGFNSLGFSNALGGGTGFVNNGLSNILTVGNSTISPTSLVTTTDPNAAFALALARFQAAVAANNLVNFANSGFVAFNNGVIGTTI
jgi:hypothetical protein